MDAVSLDRQIILQRATTAKDAFNADIETWAPLATVWAHKAPISDGERVRAQEVGAMVTNRYRIRWDSSWSSLSADDRLTDAGVAFNITAVKEIGRREGLEITAAARAEGGA
jgi:SPP1 family predicted phage head-tail adaptor